MDAVSTQPLNSPALTRQGGVGRHLYQRGSGEGRFAWNCKRLSTMRIDQGVFTAAQIRNDPFLTGSGDIRPLFREGAIPAGRVGATARPGTRNRNVVQYPA